MPEFPRVLVLSQVVPETSYAGAIVLQRLFRDYPPERLLVAGPRPLPASQTLPCRYLPLEDPLNPWTRTRFATLVLSLQAASLLPGPRLGSPMKEALEAFQPDVVVSVMQMQPYYHLAYTYARSRRIPHVLIVHDIMAKFERVYSWAAGSQTRRDAAVYRHAAARLCVSPQMAAYFERTFGAAGDVMYPNRAEDLTPRPSGEAAQLRESGVLTVGYAGSLAYGYGEQLERMLAALGRANCRLRLYSAVQPQWAASPFVQWCGFASSPLTTWRRIQSECDAVILPYSWQATELHDQYRTHFPSKLTEYVALGMPVLVLGPAWATGVRWALDNPGAALVVTADDPAAWESALTQLRDSAELRVQLAATGRGAGLSDFDPVAIRQRFHERLVEVAARKTSLEPMPEASFSEPATSRMEVVSQ